MGGGVMELALVTDKGRFECPVCFKRFIKVGDKKRHLKDRHPKKGH